MSGSSRSLTLLSEIVGFSEAQKDDIAWFLSHPNRSHRFRMTTPAERVELADCVPPDEEITHVVIRQVQPGINVRKLMNLNPAKGYMADVLLGGYGEEGLKLDFLLSEVFETESVINDRSFGTLVSEALVKYSTRGCA